jgi:hypothetical protein
MGSRRLYVVLVIAMVTLTIINNHFSTTSSQEYDETWWNSSWNYRIKIAVNTTNYNRTDWPVEVPINFTQLLEQNNVSGTFDTNSTRVFEINGSGDNQYEMKSQFDKAIDYQGIGNAVGEVIFLLNGTVEENTVKYFYIYYDIEENTKKEYPNYQSGLSATWDEQEAIINTSNYIYYIDTDRGQNTSGIYKIQYWSDIVQTWFELFTESGAAERTREYIQLTNGSNNFSYDLRQNGTLIEGPVRITFRQEGDETYWDNQDIKTGNTRLLKEYKFYYNQNHSWVYTNISNIDSVEIYRNSTNVGAVAFEANAAYGTFLFYLEPSEPSWVRGAGGGGSGGVGFLNYNQTDTDNFNASYTGISLGRVGINLENTTIPVGGDITHTSSMLIHPSNDTADYWYEYYKPILRVLNISYDVPEKYVVEVETITNFNNVSWPVTIFNRNESILITANITFDPWELNSTMNATIDNGTASTADDTTITLYDDGTNGDETSGDYIFTGYYNLSDYANLGNWNLSTTIFDSYGYVLNETYINFTLTKLLNVITSVDDPTGLGLRNVTSTIKLWNWRNDSAFSGATLNCTYWLEQVDPVNNVSDQGNGTYLVWFDAPPDYGTYVLNCSADVDGNDGYDLDEFTVESAETEVVVNHSVTYYDAYNVGFYENESFEIDINITNIGNSSAYDTNFTLEYSP